MGKTIHRHVRDVSRIPLKGMALAVGKCPDCGKLSYRTRSDAKLAALRQPEKGKLRAYRCGSWWHLTSQATERVTNYREKKK